MQDFKLGPLDGAAALIVIVVAIVAALALVAVFVVNIVKAVKERNDQKEDQAENEFFAEYGVTGEELRLNQKSHKNVRNFSDFCVKRKSKPQRPPSLSLNPSFKTSPS